MNPEKVRTECGKLIYLLQDAVSPPAQPCLGFKNKRRLHKFQEEKDGTALLSDTLIEAATQEILPLQPQRQ
jgi:Protein of unknown function (DUF2009)